MKKLITLLLLLLAICFANAMYRCCSKPDEVHQPVPLSQVAEQGGSSRGSRNFLVYRLEPTGRPGEYGTSYIPGIPARKGDVIDIVLVASIDLKGTMTVDMSNLHGGEVSPGTSSRNLYELYEGLTEDFPSDEIGPMDEDEARKVCMRETGDRGWEGIFKQSKKIYPLGPASQYYVTCSPTNKGIQIKSGGQFNIIFRDRESQDSPAFQLIAIVRKSRGAL